MKEVILAMNYTKYNHGHGLLAATKINNLILIASNTQDGITAQANKTDHYQSE